MEKQTNERPRYMYSIKDRSTGEIVFRGTCKQVAEKFGCGSRYLKDAYKRNVCFKTKYKVLREKS